MCLGNTSIYFSLGKHLMHTNSHSRLHRGDSAEASKPELHNTRKTHITPANLATDWRWCIQGVSMGLKKNVICKPLRAACWNEWHSRRNKRSVNSGLFYAAAGPLLELMSKALDRQPVIPLEVLEQLNTCCKASNCNSGCNSLLPSSRWFVVSHELTKHRRSVVRWKCK